MPSPILKFTNGRFVDTNYGIFVKATKKKPLLFQKRNGKKATRGRWMHLETEVFYSMVMKKTMRDRAVNEPRKLYSGNAVTKTPMKDGRVLVETRRLYSDDVVISFEKD